MALVETIDLNCTVPNCPNISDFVKDEYVYNKPENFVLICLYIPIFVVALVSNIFVIVNISRIHGLKSVTNCLLLNLSASDLLVTLLCMPMAVGQATYSLWIFGELMCKLSNYLQGVAVCSGVFTMAALSVYRYLKTAHPLKLMNINRRCIKQVIVAIWVLALIIFAPILKIRKIHGFRFAWDEDLQEFLYCVESWPNNSSQRYFGIIWFVLVYAIPGLIVVMAYSLIALQIFSTYSTTSNPSFQLGLSSVGNNSALQATFTGSKSVQERRYTAKILIAAAITFALSWLPYSVFSLILDLNSSADNKASNTLVNLAKSLSPYALLLGHANTVANPIFHYLQSKDIRRSVERVLIFFRNPIRFLREQCQPKVTAIVRFYRRAPGNLPRNDESNTQGSHVVIDFHPQHINPQDGNGVQPNNPPCCPDNSAQPFPVHCHSPQYPYFANESLTKLKVNTSQTSINIGNGAYLTKNVAHSCGGGTTSVYPIPAG